MHGIQLRFFTLQDTLREGKPLAHWLMELARSMGIRGATSIAANEGFGHHRRFHSAHFFELADQCVEEALESIEVSGGDVHDEGIGRDESVDPQAPLEVHLPGEAATNLHGVEVTPKCLGERAVDQALEAPFELLESHAGVSLPVPTPW